MWGAVAGGGASAAESAVVRGVVVDEPEGHAWFGKDQLDRLDQQAVNAFGGRDRADVGRGAGHVAGAVAAHRRQRIGSIVGPLVGPLVGVPLGRGCMSGSDSTRPHRQASTAVPGGGGRIRPGAGRAPGRSAVIVSGSVMENTWGSESGDRWPEVLFDGDDGGAQRVDDPLELVDRRVGDAVLGSAATNPAAGSPVAAHRKQRRSNCYC